MANKRQILFTSDWHIGHETVLNFFNRPFKNLDHMHQVLINNHNAIATEKTTTYFLGDMGLCSSQLLKDVISQLKGIKVLILGNHDKKHKSMYNLGFDVVMNNATLYIANEKVTLSHCPLIGLYRENTEGMKGSKEGENWHGELRDNVNLYAVKNEGQFHLHGHIHSPNRGKSTRILERQLDVGVDANNYRPLTISQIESFIVKTLKSEQDAKRSEK